MVCNSVFPKRKDISSKYQNQREKWFIKTLELGVRMGEGEKYVKCLKLMTDEGKKKNLKYGNYFPESQYINYKEKEEDER